VKKIIFAALLLTFSTFSSFVCAQKTDSDKQMQVQSVSSVDMKRFAGKWFEISRYPNKSQKNCVGNTTVTYTQKDDVFTRITIDCLKKDGTVENVKMDAKVADKTTNAKFEMSSSPKNYWIVDLDADYKYAAVADPKRETLWILSRESELSDAVYQNILRRVEMMGFKPGKLSKTAQNVEVVKGGVIEKQ
jgi:apolipoprotein D and lipocalin family protein